RRHRPADGPRRPRLALQGALQGSRYFQLIAAANQRTPKPGHSAGLFVAMSLGAVPRTYPSAVITRFMRVTQSSNLRAERIPRAADAALPGRPDKPGDDGRGGGGKIVGGPLSPGADRRRPSAASAGPRRRRR